MERWERLGEILLRRGLITEEELAEALENQMLFGGRIGTSLVELSFASLDDVSRALVIQHGVPRGDADPHPTIPPSILSIVDHDFCAANGVFPIRIERGELYMAMLDPSEEKVVELEEKLERPIQPLVLPELRLFHFLERYYQVERPTRFLRLPDGGEVDARRRRYLKATDSMLDNVTVTDAQQRTEMEATDPQKAYMVFVPLGDYDVKLAEESSDDVFRGTGTTMRMQGPGTVELVWLDDIAKVKPAIDKRPEDEHAIEDIVQQLRETTSGGKIARTLVQPICPEASLSVLFWVRGDYGLACCAGSIAPAKGRLEQLVVPLDKPSLLHWAYNKRGVAWAKAHDDELQQRIAEFLGGPNPGEACVAPVIMGGNVVNLLLVQSLAGTGFGQHQLQGLRTIARTAGAAYRRLRDLIDETLAEDTDPGPARSL